MAGPPAKPAANRLVTAKITVILVVTLWAFAITAVLRGRLAYDGAPEAREVADPPAAAEHARPREPPAALPEQRARGDEGPEARPVASAGSVIIFQIFGYALSPLVSAIVRLPTQLNTPPPRA